MMSPRSPGSLVQPAMISEIRDALHRAVDLTGSPGAVLYVGDCDTTYVHEARGLRQRVPSPLPATEDTIYDLASLTKVVATTMAVMRLRDAGRIDLDQPIIDFVPIGAFRAITLRHLLTHTGGLAPTLPLYKEVDSLDAMLAGYARDGIMGPPGGIRRYSDAGFMLLGNLVERAAGMPFDVFCRETLFDPLDMRWTAFNPPESWRDRCAATENCVWRKRIIRGEVHDENAYAVGGVAGHAGLFSTAEDLAKFVRALLSGRIVAESTLIEMTTAGHVPSYPWQGLGWQLDPWRGKAQGYLPSREAFGHTGWTGTSMWIDRRSGLFAILLANTCHPSRERRDNARFRRIVHTVVAEHFYPRTTNVQTGLDRLLYEDFQAVLGKRVAVLTHHAAVDRLGRHILDVLALSPSTRVQVVYSPEHGLYGQAEAGERVAGQTARVPVISLYGEQKAPKPDELNGVELFIVDLQDVGARYYTYMATMKRCLEACAAARVPVLILDRPNPLGGEVLEGPIAVETASDVCSAQIPVRHGMTMGEIALFFQATEFKGNNLDLRVSQLDNWRPNFLFDQCGLAWVAPSPNIPRPQTALLYAGTCLFEGTNLNEGRGTDTPFALIGAPWLDAAQVIDDIEREDRAGMDLDAVAYTPRAIQGKAANPRYKDEPCRGVRIIITGPDQVRSFRLAVALIIAIRRRHPDRFEFTPFFDTLVGGPDLRGRIERGHYASDIAAAYAAPLADFDRGRPKLYTFDPLA